MRTIVKLFSNTDEDIYNFLNKFLNFNSDVSSSKNSDVSIIFNDYKIPDKHTLEWEKFYENPIEMVDIIGAFIENDDKYNITMWISLDEDALINVTDVNADEIIRYLYERFPY